MAEVGSAFVTVVPSAKGFGKKLDAEVGPDLEKTGKSSSKRLGSSFSSGLKSALAPGLALLSTAAVGSFLKSSIGEAREAQKVGALTNNVIKQTGGVANISAKQVGNLATAISLKSGIDDEAIQSGSNLLLTFKNVRNEAGKGADIFNRATQAAVDLSASGFGDLAGTSKQLGKALNDPVKGISALGRAGVTFTDAQKKQIAGFVKANDLLSAQKIILKEVESQVGGSAAATATSGEKAAVAFGNLKEQIGTALLPVVDDLATRITNDVVPAVSEFVSGLQDGTGAGGRTAKAIRDVYNAAKPVAATVLTIVKAFAGLPGSAQKVLLLAGAALILSRRYADSISSLQNFTREQAVATAKTVAMRAAALGLGVGLASLSSQAGGASHGLGALAAVGAGVATGFAVGGPWGAAIGGAGGILSVFTAKSSSAAAAQGRLNAGAATVVGTLNQQTGAMTRLTRATTAKALADSGAFTEAKKVGASYKDVLNAALGNEAATKRVKNAIQSYSDAQGNRLGVEARVAKSTANLRGAIGQTSSAIADERRKIEQANAAMGKVKDRNVQFKVTTPGLFGALATIGSLSGAIDRIVAKQNRIRIGKNAQGTDNWRGGLTMVGEKGPELINLAKGAQVIPNHRLGDIASAGSPLPTGGGGSQRDLEAAVRRAFDGSTLHIPGLGSARLATAGA